MILNVSLTQIDDNPYQPRLSYDPQGIEELARDIQQRRADLPSTLGLIHIPLGRVILSQSNPEIINPTVDCQHTSLPNLLKELHHHRVQLAAGHRRLRAFQWLNNLDHTNPDWAEIPIDLVYLDDESIFDIAFSENARRANLNAIEEARAIEMAIHKFNRTAKQVGEGWGLAESTVSNKRRLLQLPEAVQELIRTGALTEKHGREILPLVQVVDQPGEAIKLARQAAREGWQVGNLSSRVKWRLQDFLHEIEEPVIHWSKVWNREFIDLPEGCIPRCDQCPLHVRHNGQHYCTDVTLRRAKYESWRTSVEQAASKKFNLPIHRGYELSPSALEIAQGYEGGCINLALRHSPYRSGNNSQPDPQQFPGVYYSCQAKDCDCYHTAVNQNQATHYEANPQLAAYHQWRDGQQREARQFLEETRTTLETKFRLALSHLEPKQIAPFVALIYRISGAQGEAPADHPAIARELATLSMNVRQVNIRSRVGQVKLDLAQTRRLARLSDDDPNEELQAHLRIIQDTLEEREFEPSIWKRSAEESLQAAAKILQEQPNPELAAQLQELSRRWKEFSQEKK